MLETIFSQTRPADRVLVVAPTKLSNRFGHIRPEKLAWPAALPKELEDLGVK